MTTSDAIATLPVKRVGLIVPSSNTVMECDFYERLPRKYQLHTSRMYLDSTTVAGEREMLDDHLPSAARNIRTAKPDVCVFGCTSAGALRGNAYETELIEQIEEDVRCPVVSVASAARSELRQRGAGSVTVVTPYGDDLNKRIQESLETDGLTVDGIYGLGIEDNFAIASVTPTAIADMATNAQVRHQADALFISCTNLRALEVAIWLESALEVPVVTSNGAALRAALTALEEFRDEDVADAVRLSTGHRSWEPS